MVEVRKLAVYIDRANQQLIVRDQDGNFWIVPCDDNGWDQRQPYHPTEDIELEPIPGHYKHTLGLPV